ncbi:unnamed protein product [Owenia fusiformis]|uniref:Uncharacterized protein n=1 Tax=Owenia fusiformis TaxID=6347 RepID=A0A8J1U780_OWEFU|nr:unnamed protein product [Owenia fusiformis]
MDTELTNAAKQYQRLAAVAKVKKTEKEPKNNLEVSLDLPNLKPELGGTHNILDRPNRRKSGKELPKNKQQASHDTNEEITDPYMNTETSVPLIDELDKVSDDNKLSESKPEVDIFNDSDFDTDVEENEESELKKYRSTPCRELYIKICNRLNVIPIGTILSALSGKQDGVTQPCSEINLKNRCIGENDIIALSNALMINSTISKLLLDGNSIDANGAYHLSLMFYENVFIRQLGAANNSLKGKGVDILCEVLLENTFLSRIDLSGNKLDDQDAVTLAKVLQESSTLYHLDLSHNNFTDKGAINLGHAIGLNDALRYLNISWNNIRSKGGIAIADSLKNNCVLKTLHMSMNGISNDGALAMAKALKINTVLNELDISSNRIHDISAMTFEKAFEVNESIKIFKIGKNPVTSVTAISILNGLRKNESKKITLLDMTGIHVHVGVTKCIDIIKDTKPDFNIILGGVFHSNMQFGTGHKNTTDYVSNPIHVLRWFMASRNLRLIDLFKKFDKNGDWKITKKEFRDGMRSIKVPLTEAQLEQLMATYDKDGDGSVDFGEMALVDAELRRKAKREADEAVGVQMTQEQFEELAAPSITTNLKMTEPLHKEEIILRTQKEDT